MTTSTIPTSITLNRVGEILQFDPWSLNGFSLPAVRIRDNCAAPFEQSYGDTISRDDLATAINSAESMISEQLGYNIFPQYETQTLQTPRWKKPYYKSSSHNLQTDNKGYLIDVAKEKRDFLGTYPVERIDGDNDGFEEIATLDLSAHRLIESHELRVFYKDTDVEIRPIKILDKGEVRTASTQIYNIGKWTMLNAIDFTPLTYDDDNSYEIELDVYRIYPDKTNPVKLLYNPDSLPCVDNDCDKQFIEVCGYVTHPKFGYFTHQGQITPDNMEVSILSGYQGRDKRTLDRKFEIPIVALGVSLLTKELSCDGNNQNSIMSKWQSSILAIDPGISRVLTQNLTSDFFGLSTYGSYLAQNFVKNNRLFNR